MNGLGLLAIAVGVGVIAVLLLRRDRARTLGRVALLDAIEKGARGGVESADVTQMAEATLRPLTRAFSPADGLLALWTLDPPREGRVEGFAPVRWASASIAPEIVRWLLSAEGIVLTEDLAERIVREPALRQVHALFEELGIALVAPAVSDGEVHGALLVPAPLGGVPFDEGVVAAFAEAARWLAPPLAHFAGHARAAERETAWLVERRAISADRDRERVRARAATGVARPTFVARSVAMQTLLAEVERSAPDGGPLLVVGSAGSGAERVARAVHAAGPRRDGPFVVREARRLRSSDFQSDGAAAGGTLLVRDVPALPAALVEPLDLAAKAGAYRLVGTSRIDAGALDEEILRIFPAGVRVPPLAERRDDLPELAAIRLRDLATAIGRPELHLSPSAIETLGRHPWPGNVIELDLVLADAAGRAKGERIEAADLRLLVAPASSLRGSKRDPRPS